MTIEDKKEIVKAYFYKYDKDLIAENFNISEDEINKIIEENQEVLKELEERNYD